MTLKTALRIAMMAGALVIILSQSASAGEKSRKSKKGMDESEQPCERNKKEISYHRDGKSLVLVCDCRDHVILQITTDGDETFSEEKEFLMAEALRLTSGKEMPLGKSGYHFRFSQGKPLHQFFANYIPGKNAIIIENLRFAEHASCDDRTIVASGPAKIKGPDPYRALSIR